MHLHALHMHAVSLLYCQLNEHATISVEAKTNYMCASYY